MKHKTLKLVESLCHFTPLTHKEIYEMMRNGMELYLSDEEMTEVVAFLHKEARLKIKRVATAILNIDEFTGGTLKETMTEVRAVAISIRDGEYTDG